jgi:glycosyltransferase involved in cell wall biosynthesis
MDNGSQDGTLEILEKLKEEGISITVFQNKCLSFNESNHLTFLYRYAVEQLGADWVASLDVDEFIDDRYAKGGLEGTLRHYMQSEHVTCIKISSTTYHATQADVAAEPIVPIRVRRRLPPSPNYKVIVRGGPARAETRVCDGGHGIENDGPGEHPIDLALRLAHYSERSPFQYLVKFVRGWNKVLAAGPTLAASGVSFHYRVPYEMLHENPARFLRDARFMGFKNETPDLIDDPIDYQGGTLRYTHLPDEPMRAIKSLLGVMQDLAVRHGAFMEGVPAMREEVARLDAEYQKIL